MQTENIKKGWKKVKLGEIIDIFDNQRIPLSSIEREKKKGIFPYYGASGIIDNIDNFIFNGEYLLISEDGANLTTRNTPIAFLVNGKFWVNNHAHIVRGKNNIGNTKYIMYFIESNNISGYITGSAQPKLSQQNMANIEIIIPESIQTQQKIASILSKYDDLIENNSKRIKILEEMAQEIYKEWFVNFRFPCEECEKIKQRKGQQKTGQQQITGQPQGFAPTIENQNNININNLKNPVGAMPCACPDYCNNIGHNCDNICIHKKMVDSLTEFGEIPEGWEIKKVGEIFNTVLGGTPSRNNPDFWGGNIPWVNSGKVNELRIINESEFITEEGYKKSSTKLMPIRTTLLAITGATLGQVSLTEIEVCANQSVVGIYDKNKKFSNFIYCYIKNNIQEIIKSAGGGAQQHINKDIVNEINILIPNIEIIEKFNLLINNIFGELFNLQKQNQNLKQTRDMLIPKLVSGEVEVDSLDIKF